MNDKVAGVCDRATDRRSGACLRSSNGSAKRRVCKGENGNDEGACLRGRKGGRQMGMRERAKNGAATCEARRGRLPRPRITAGRLSKGRVGLARNAVQDRAPRQTIQREHEGAACGTKVDEVRRTNERPRGAAGEKGKKRGNGSEARRGGAERGEGEADVGETSSANKRRDGDVAREEAW